MKGLLAAALVLPPPLFLPSTSGRTQSIDRTYEADDELGRRAGLTGCSLMLALGPRMVQTDVLRHGTGPNGGDGVDRDPTRASAELGRLDVALTVAQTVDGIRKSITQRERRPLNMAW